MKKKIVVYMIFTIILGLLILLSPTKVFADDSTVRYLMDAAAMPDGKIAILFIKGGTSSAGVISDGTLYFGIYNPTGNGWTQEPVGEMAPVAKEATLALHGDIAHVAYITSEDKIAYTYQTGSGWSEEQIIESNNSNGENGVLSSPDMAVGSDGKVHIAYVDSRGADDGDFKKPDGMYVTNASGEWVKTVVANCTGWRDAGVDYDNFITPIKIDYANNSHHIAYKIHNYSTDGWGGKYNNYRLYFKSTTDFCYDMDTNSSGKIYEVCKDNDHNYTLISRDGKYVVFDDDAAVDGTEKETSISCADMTLYGPDIYYAAINGTSLLFYQNGTFVEDKTADTAILSNHGKFVTVVSDGKQYVIYTGADEDKSLVISKLDGEEFTEYVVPKPVTTIEADLTDIDFGSIGKGFTKEESDNVLQTVRITNTGTTTITLNNQNPASSGPFGCYWFDSTREILPGEYQDVRLRLAESSAFANTAGNYSGTYTITATNIDDNTDTAIINIDATAILLEKYTVTFDTSGGSSVASQEVIDGENAIEPENPTKNNFAFSNWYKEDLETLFDFDEPITEDTTIYALWIPTVIVTYDLNGGTAGKDFISSVEMPDEVLISEDNLTEDFAKAPTGYIYAGIEVNGVMHYKNSFGFLHIKENSIVKFIWNKLISVINLTMTLPEVGEKTSMEKDGEYWTWENVTNPPKVKAENNPGYTIEDTFWIKEFDQVGSSEPFVGTFESKKQYNAEIVMFAKEGFYFAENITVKVNGQNADAIIEKDKSFLNVGKKITPTEKVFPFTDVKTTNWYYNAVKYCYDNNIMSGLNATSFGPTNKLTRGMMVTILYRMEGSPKITGTPSFTDVKDSSKYYYKAVKWASDKKIVSGYNDGRFGPGDNITREQLAVILWKYAKYKGKDVSKTNDLSAFSDKGKVANYAVSQVKWAVGAGVITGSNGKLNPKGNATRAEVAAMMEKYCKKVGR